jgi:hypothetical protein
VPRHGRIRPTEDAASARFEDRLRQLALALVVAWCDSVVLVLRSRSGMREAGDGDRADGPRRRG